MSERWEAVLKEVPDEEDPETRKEPRRDSCYPEKCEIAYVMGPTRRLHDKKGRPRITIFSRCCGERLEVWRKSWIHDCRNCSRATEVPGYKVRICRHCNSHYHTDSGYF